MFQALFPFDILDPNPTLGRNNVQIHLGNMALKHAKLIQYLSTLFYTFLIWTLFPSDFNKLFFWCFRHFWILFPLDILDPNSRRGDNM